jgi:hypothetical protein
MMIKSFKILLVALLVVCSFHFFEAKFLSKAFVYYLPFFYVAFAIAISMPFFFAQREGFVLPVQLIVIAMLISIFFAHLSWGQGFTNSILGTIPMMLWAFFFYLLQKKIPVQTIEKIIVAYGIIYCGLFFYQLLNSQTVIFGSGDEFIEERGTVRVYIAGQGGLFLASFMALNKFTSQKKYRLFWIALAFAGLVIPIIQATRQFILGVLIIFVYHFIKDVSVFKKVVVLAFFVGLLLCYITFSNNVIIKGLIETQEQTAQEGRNNLRVLAGAYFLTELSPDNINKVFGNGVPSGEDSSYSRFVDSLNQYGLYMSDVGIIAVYAMFGIFGVLGYILIWIKSFTLPLPKDYYYLKYYLWFLLITSLTSDTIYSYNFLICTVFVIYLYQMQYLNHPELTTDSLSTT